MIKKSWLKHFPIFLDPKLKGHDGLLFQSIALFLTDNGFFLDDDPNKGEVLLPPLRIAFKENSHPNSFIIKYKEPNMSLFASESNLPGIELGGFSSLEEFKKSFTLYVEKLSTFILSKEVELFQKYLKQLKKVSSAKFLKEQRLNEKEANIIEKFEKELFCIIQNKDIKGFLENYNKINEQRIYLLNSDEVLNSKLKLFPLKNSLHLSFIGFENCSDILAVNLFATISNAMERLEKKDAKIIAFKEFDELFSKLDIPLAVFDQDQNLILHNNLFIDLNLSVKECFNFKVNEQVTIKNNTYKVQKILESKNNLIHLNFIPVNEVLGNHSPSSEELGIVSSSIAHELNNPLAGVLAALNVLELDDYDEEIYEKINQMKQSVNRCKKLVETFLGFSKVNNEDRGLTSYGKESFMQAMELMRFRLIENNITIPIQYQEKEKLSYPVSSHVLSMIFYLFLGELLTCFAHQNLVALNNSKRIELSVLENYNGIILSFDKQISLTDNLIKSKLANHLVEGEKLSLNYQPGRIELFYKDELGKS